MVLFLPSQKGQEQKQHVWGSQGWWGARVIFMKRSKAGMAQPGGVNSVSMAPWLVSHQRAENEHLLSQDSRFTAQPMKIIQQEV